MIGQHLGNYRIERLLGRGGMAHVYYGWDENLERPVAVKTLDARFREDPDYARRFVQEAQAVANWRHENIVQVYYAGEQGGTTFFAMEYVEGADLGALLAEYTAAGELFPQAEVVRIGGAVASALDYAHRRQVIHRDVKPGNVLIARDGRVLLADFGLALDVQKGTMGETFGTPHYIAPEQVRSSADAVAASDLYSLGVILYEMLTGTVPFDDPSPTSLALQHLTTPPPPPRALNPELNQATEQVLLRALSKDPAARYQSGEALMAALETGLASPPAAETAEPWPLPPLPAGVEPPNPRTLSRLPVAERLTLMEPELSAVAEAGTTTAPAGTDGAFPWLRSLMVVAGLTLLLLVLLFVVARLPGGDRRQPATEPAVLAVATERAATPTPPATEAGTEMDTGATEIPPASNNPAPATPLPPSATPTDTPEPSPSPAPTGQVSGAPTVAFPGGRRVQMVYDADSFYLWNPGSEQIPFSVLVFEALTADGQPAGYRFEGRQWAVTGFNALTTNGCAGLKAFEVSERPPAQCLQLNSLRTPTMAQLEADAGFWFTRPGANAFRILWNELEVARCETEAQTCEVLLPAPD